MKAGVGLFLLAALMSAGCSNRTNESAPAEVAISEEARMRVRDPLKRAESAATEFNRRLRGALQSAMESRGAAAAIEICAEAAPAIAEDVMRSHKLRLGRVAAPGKNRHPDQEAEGWTWEALREMIEAVQAGAPAGEQMKVFEDHLPDGIEFRMIRGIPTEALCTRCHGEEIDPSVEAKLKELYPGDGARGFREGSLRGALWVEITTM